MLALAGLNGLLFAACAATRPYVPAVVAQPAATPREALVTAYTALAAGDETRLLSVCRANSRQREQLSALAKTEAASNEFQKAIVAAYGNEGWEHFCGKKEPVPDGHGATAFHMEFLSEKQIAQIQNLPIDERRSEAFCLVPSRSPEPTPEQKATEDQAGDKEPKEPTRIRIVKDHNGWLVDAGTLAPGMTAKQADAMTSLVRKHQPQIGQPGVTPSQISTQMSGELVGMILSGKLR
jgi:predicted secreted protein